MHILFLDDSKERCRIIKDYVTDVQIVYTARQAITRLQKYKNWDVVFLDHDLGGEFMPSDAKSGMAVVNFIIEKQISIVNIVIHSHNFPAAQNMVAKLKAAQYNVNYVPFHTLVKNLKENKSGI